MTTSIPKAATDDPVLSLRELRIGFAARDGSVTEVVHGIDLEVRPGRVLALVGESGSGKSVTAMSTMRLLPPEARVTGSIEFRHPDGSALDVLAAGAAELRALRGAGIGAVFQEPLGAWNPVQTIGAQLSEALRAHDEPAHRDHVEQLLATAGLDESDRIARSFPHQLSGGQLQRAMIAMATCCTPNVVLADEPTTALDVTVQAGVLDVLRSLAAGGTAILLITHDMGVVSDLADDVVVLRDGEIVESGSVREVLTTPRAAYTRDLLASVPALSATAVAAGSSATEPAAVLAGIEVQFRSQGKPLRAVDGVDLELAAGRTLGVVGESGSGKSTLGRVLTGLIRPSAGTVRVGEVDITTLRRGALRNVQRELGIVFQDPGSSLNPKHTVGRSLAEPLRLASWQRADADARVAELLTDVQLDPGYAQRFPHQLSGGQRQRVAIARALALRPRVLVADEPTSALDVSVQARILELITRLQRELGFACLFISHDLAVVAAVAHEVAVLRAGHVVEQGPAADVLGSPRDDYTRRLLAAAPVTDPDEQRERREARLAHTATMP